MGINQNVAGVEKTARIVLGIILILLGFFVPGIWKTLFIVAGVVLLVTGLAGY